MNKEQLARRLLATFAAELEEQVGAMNADLLALEGNPTDADRLRSIFRIAHSLKGAARAAGVPAIEQTCHTLEAMLADARDGKLILGRAEFGLLFSAADALGDARSRLTSGEVRQEPPAAGPASRATDHGDGQLRVESAKLDALLGATSQLLITSGRAASRPAEAATLHDLAKRASETWTRHRRGLRRALERSDAAPALVQAVADIEQGLAELRRGSDRIAVRAAEDARILAHATDDVADRARRLRMRPFAEACDQLPRAVRDLADTARKEVDLHIAGAEVEVDRAVLDGLREALLPLVRNAVDHGIETPVERARAGKPRRGAVRVTATLRGDGLTVTVADDGAGLDLSAIRARLASRGLPIPEDDRGLARTLFESGMSTRAEATPISGRGVGLDVVRAAMKRIRGVVDLAWIEGRGTTFMLECPPTLATIRAVLASVGPQLVAMPTAFVERLLRVRRDEVKQAEGRDVVIGPWGPIPLGSLARLLPPLVERPATGARPVIVLRVAEQRLAVAVDELVAEQELVVRPVLRDQEPAPHVSGAAILGSGRVVLVLDPATIIGKGLGLDGAARVAFATDAETGRGPRRILVVDDSITTRTLEQSILEAAGYDVLTAADGADGWRLLQEQQCDLVLADVEMPRMDGFALCEAIRGSKRHTKLPVVLVTALETPEHRLRGLEAGADAYLGKSSFDQQALLDTIGQLVG